METKETPHQLYARLVAEAAGKSKHKAMNREEQDLQIALFKVLDYGLAKGFKAFHIPNGGHRTKAEAGILKAMGVLAGAPDVQILQTGGLVYFLELKKRRGKARKAQIEFQRWCAEHAVPYEIADSLAEALDHLTTWGALKIGLRILA